MYNRNLHTKNSGANKVNQYLVKEIMDATPEQLLIKVYNFAISSCQKHDMVKTNNAIQELINGLRFDDDETKELATGLLRLYQYCQDQMRANNYDIVIKILTELRQSWIDAISKM